MISLIHIFNLKNYTFNSLSHKSKSKKTLNNFKSLKFRESVQLLLLNKNNKNILCSVKIHLSFPLYFILWNKLTLIVRMKHILFAF